MKRLIYVLLAILVFSCQERYQFYAPDRLIVVDESKVDTDTLIEVSTNIRLELARKIFYAGRYLLAIQDNPKKIFTVIDISSDSVLAEFGQVGHANNEFISIPKNVYSPDGNNIYVQEFASTKVIDLMGSIGNNNCYVKEIIKETYTELFHTILHSRNGSIFVYKDVSYEDARDAIYYKPEFFLINKQGDICRWNLYPYLLFKGDKAISDISYVNEVYIKPDGEKAIEMLHCVDLLNIFDFKADKVTGLLSPHSYTFDDIYSKMTVGNMPEILRWYNMSACVTNENFFVLKDGRLYAKMMNGEDDNGFSEIYVFDWNGKLFKKCITKRRLGDIAFDESAKVIYGLGLDGAIYKYKGL